MRKILLSALLVATVAAAQDYTTPYGEWRGQAQYQAMIKSVSDPAAHAVTNLTLGIEPGGKIVGASAENGCRFLGIAKPGIVATIVGIEVTTTGCAYPGLNRTYKGNLSVYVKERRADLSLQAVSISPPNPGNFTIVSTMRR